jgi:hypothetical protein
MTQVDNELTGKGNVDVWEVDCIVGARRLGDGTCLYAVVWTDCRRRGWRHLGYCKRVGFRRTACWLRGEQ